MNSNTNAGKIATLLETLSERLGNRPEQAVEAMLFEMTQFQEDSLLKLLQCMEETSRKKAPVSDKADQAEGTKTHAHPEDGSYVPMTEHSAICRGCEVGCELKWDDDGNYEGYSCCNGEETARLLALIRKNQVH